MVREKKPVKGVRREGVRREDEKRRGGRLGKEPGGGEDIESKVRRAAAVAANELRNEEKAKRGVFSPTWEKPGSFVGAEEARKLEAVHPHPKVDCLLNLGQVTPHGDLSAGMKMLLRGDHGRDVLVVSVAENAIGPEGRAAFIASMAGLGVDAVFLPYSPSTVAAPQLTMYSIE